MGDIKRGRTTECERDAVDDLSPVLVDVAADARPHTRAKIANSDETRAFLEVGLMLLRDDLLDHRGPDLLADGDAHWAEVYEALAGRYGLELRPGYTWLDVAELFNAVADGARLRAQGTGAVARLSSGDDVLVGAVHALIPGMFVGDGTR